MSSPKLDKGTKLRNDAVEVDLRKRLANYKMIKICLWALMGFGTLYITDANSYIINLPAGAWVWAYNGYITSFTEAPYNLISVASSAAYLRVLLVAMFYIPFFVAWNANRMNKPAIT